MNERLKLLAEKAKHETALYGGKAGDKEFDQRFQQIFGELIVQECAVIADNTYDCGKFPVGCHILERFGVEE